VRNRDVVRLVILPVIGGCMSGRFMRRQAVLESTGLSRSAMHRLIVAGKFPASRQLVGNTVFWLETEIDSWKADVLRGSCGGKSEA
jgi:predicted DNA-binding transcriptional regulator AlpA